MRISGASAGSVPHSHEMFNGSDNGIYQLRRCDEDAIFPDDDAAWRTMSKW